MNEISVRQVARRSARSQILARYLYSGSIKKVVESRIIKNLNYARIVHEGRSTYNF